MVEPDIFAHRSFLQKQIRRDCDTSLAHFGLVFDFGFNQGTRLEGIRYHVV